MTTPALRRKLLEIIARSAPYALTESSILIEINEHARPPLRASDLDYYITVLSGKDAIRQLAGQFDDDERRWHITEIGRVMLQS